jgi:hypothetical protein
MSNLPRPPASCADLDPAVVERRLAKHYGDITGAARSLELRRNLVCLGRI